MSNACEFQVYFPGGDRNTTSGLIVQAMNLAGIKVFLNLESSPQLDAAVTWFHGRGRVRQEIHTVLQSLSCPVIGIELPDDGDRADPITILDLQLDSDTPPAAITHAIRKQIQISRTLTDLIRIESQLNNRRNRLDEVFETGIRLTRTLSHHELFQLVVDRAASLLSADLHALFTIEGSGSNCRLRATSQKIGCPSSKITPSFRIRSDGRTALSQMSKPLALSPPFQKPAWMESIAAHFKTAKTLLIAPFVSKGHLLGFIVMVQFGESRIFSPSEIERLEVLCAFSSVALGNAFVYDQAETLSRIDDLTGSYNFGFIQNFLDRMISAGEHFSLVFIDLDGFKKINLLHGHTIGNRALRQAAIKIRDSLMSFCLSGRFGGDEFVLVIPGKNAEESRLMTEKVIASIETVIIESEISLSASAGIAEFPSDGDNINSIIHAADTAMYAAKDQGRGQTVLFQDLSKGQKV